jgi:hypothetical protein
VELPVLNAWRRQQDAYFSRAFPNLLCTRSTEHRHLLTRVCGTPQEDALTVLGFQPPFGTIRFGPFTGNRTLMKWFTLLNHHYGVGGRASYFWKAHGAGRTPGMTAESAREELVKGACPAFYFAFDPLLFCVNHVADRSLSAACDGRLAREGHCLYLPLLQSLLRARRLRDQSASRCGRVRCWCVTGLHIAVVLWL